MVVERPFMSINETAKYTGLSTNFLRNGCKDGSIAHIMSGCKYLINVPALLQQLGVSGFIESSEK